MKVVGFIIVLFSFFKEGKWGLVRADGSIAKEAVYDYISDPNEQGFMIASLQGKYGVLDSLGTTTLPHEFDYLTFGNKTVLIGKKQQQFGLFTVLGDPIPTSDFDSLAREGTTFELFTKEGKRGKVAKDGYLLPIYDTLMWYNEESLMACKGDKQSLYTRSLQKLVPDEFDFIQSAFRYNIVRKAGKEALFNVQGTLLLPFASYSIRPIDASHCLLSSSGTASLYDLDKRQVVAKGTYEDIRPFLDLEGYYLTLKNDRTGLIRSSGETVLKNKFEFIDYIGLDRLAANDSLGDHLYSLQGKELSAYPLGELKPFDSLPVTSFYFNGKYGAVNIQGEILVAPSHFHLVVSEGRVTYFTGSKKNVVKFDERGRFLELIKNFGTIQVVDTARLKRERWERNQKILRDKGSRYGLRVLTDVIRPHPQERGPISLMNFYLYDSLKRVTYQAASPLLDIEIESLAKQDVAAGITLAGKWTLVTKNGRLLPQLLVKDELGKAQMRSFGRVGPFSEGLAPVDFANTSYNFLEEGSHLKYYGSYENRVSNVLGSSFTLKGILKSEMKKAEGATGQWGFINSIGKVVIAPSYHTVSPFVKGRAIVSVQPNAYTLITASGHSVLQGTYVQIEQDPSSDSLFLLHAESKGIGFLDTATFTMPFVAHRPSAKAMGNKLALYKHKNKKWGFYNISGEALTDSIYQEAHAFHGGLAAVCLKGKWGYLDTTGQLAIPAIYTSATDFSEGRAMVGQGEKVLLVDTKGKVVRKGGFKDFRGFKEGLAIVAKEHDYGVINREGDWVVTPKFKRIEAFESNGTASAVRDGEGFLVHRDSRVEPRPTERVEYKVTKAMKKEELERSAQHFSAKLERSFPHVTILSDPTLYLNERFVDSRYIPYRPKTLMGLADRNGNLVLPAVYSYIKPLGNGMYKVYQGNGVGYYHLVKGWMYKGFEL